MNDKMKTLQVKKFNHDYPVVLTYDQCKSGESQYGQWNLYGVEYEGEQQGIFAEDALHQKLQKYGKGARLVIRRNQDENGQMEWQVALKIATISLGQSLKPWSDEDLQEIKVRMDKLLEILDGSVSDDLPF